MLKPIFKYTGGKYDEYKSFSKFMPSTINNYYEPFVGGGGVMFQLHNDNKVFGEYHINDLSEDLIHIYNNVCSKDMIDELNVISVVWADITAYADKVALKYASQFTEMLNAKQLDVFVNDSVMNDIINMLNEYSQINKYNTHQFSLQEKIKFGLTDKCKRFIKKVEKNTVNQDEIGDTLSSAQISTSICQSFYFIIRDMYNEWLLNTKADYTMAERCAQWLFIREFCYGSMFRYGKDGKFNIPYGGHSYNSKCFQCKVDDIQEKEMQEFFGKHVHIESKDFEEFMSKSYNEDDFIFLDPPYICTFSDYDNNSFTLQDHIRLRDKLKSLGTSCKWMMVIRPTEEIETLYSDSLFHKEYFTKTYAYQPRKDATYDSKTCQHVIITNYKLITE